MTLSRQHRAACSDADFIRLFEELGPTKTAQRLNVSLRAVHFRRKSMEALIHREVVGPNDMIRTGVVRKLRLPLDIDNGVILVGSDVHCWPGAMSTAMKAFLAFCKDLKPKIVVMNGDVFDGATVSRHPPISWERRPTLVDEIEACREWLGSVEKVCPKPTQLVWTLGNHDSRFETRLAVAAPEYAKLKGVHLKDHFGERWIPTMSAWVNDAVVIKHRYKGGIHATHNNTVGAGLSIVTGHLHSLKVTPYTDYKGTRYGVDTGCLAEPDGPQFDYSEDNPRNHRSGFVVLTFNKGRLLMPELVQVFDRQSVEFRGQIIKV